jgi:hypothetical protein
VADRTAVVVNSADGRSSGAAELFDALYCRLFVHAYECLAQLAGDVEDFSAALVMVRPLLCSRRCADLHSAGRSARPTQRALPLAADSNGVRLRCRRCCSWFDARFATDLCSMHVCVCAHACACVRGVPRNLSGGQRAACNRWSGISTARLHRLQRTSTCAIIRMD